MNIKKQTNDAKIDRRTILFIIYHLVSGGKTKLLLPNIINHKYNKSVHIYTYLDH